MGAMMPDLDAWEDVCDLDTDGTKLPHEWREIAGEEGTAELECKHCGMVVTG